MCCAVQGKVVWYLQALLVWLGMGRNMHQVAYANTLEEQKQVSQLGRGLVKASGGTRCSVPRRSAQLPSMTGASERAQ